MRFVLKIHGTLIYKTKKSITNTFIYPLHQLLLEVYRDVVLEKLLRREGQLHENGVGVVHANGRAAKNPLVSCFLMR